MPTSSLILVFSLAAELAGAAEPDSALPPRACAGVVAAGGNAMGGAVVLVTMGVLAPSGVLNALVPPNANPLIYWGGLASLPILSGAVAGGLAGPLCSANPVWSGVGALAGGLVGGIAGVLPSIVLLVAFGVSDALGLIQTVAIAALPVGWTVVGAVGAGLGARLATDLSE